MYITKWKKPVLKATYCMIPTKWHSEKGKITETIKISVVVRDGARVGGGGRGQIGRARHF